MNNKESIKIFFEYLNTAAVVYKDDVCVTNMNTYQHTYDIIGDDVIAVNINPNHTFKVLFENREEVVFTFYMLTPHFCPTDDISMNVFKNRRVEVE